MSGAQKTDDRCREEVWERGGYHRYQCSRKAVKDGYCKQHHPDTKAERYAKWEKKWEENRKKEPWYVIDELKKDLETAKAEIARLTQENLRLHKELEDAGTRILKSGGK